MTLPTAIFALVPFTMGRGTALAGRSLGVSGDGTSLAAGPPALAAAPCDAHMLPDRDVCVHLAEEDEGEPEVEASPGGHHDRLGRWVVYDQIPRRPDRPADYDAYAYPVPCPSGCVFSGYDLDQPDELQRRGPHLSHVGHGGLDIAATRDEPVRLIELDHQQGPAQVVYVGPLFGTTVVTRHTIREAGRLRDYVVLFCHLDAPAPGLEAGSPLALGPGDVVGFAGDSASRGLVHLHLEVRRVREGVDVTKIAPDRLVDDADTVVCDPRNVLPLR